jgi:hypothetical protein
MGTLRHRIVRSTALGATVVLLAACGATRSVTSDTTPATSLVPAATSTAAPTTEPTESTVPEPTTTVADPNDQWTPISYDDVLMPLAYPCCASNWGLVEPSPALPAPGEPLADGVYSVEWTWPDDMTQPVVATVARFDRCNDLPEGSCEQQATYLDSDYGVGPDSVEVEIRFDKSLRVVLGGYVGFEYADKSSTLQLGNGLALAELVTQLNADYQIAVVEPVLAGTETYELVASLSASPAYGFSAPLGEGDQYGQIVYSYLDAPPLLYQALLPFQVDPNEAKGSDNIGRIALSVEDGRYTVSVYAGWYS